MLSSVGDHKSCHSATHAVNILPHFIQTSHTRIHSQFTIHSNAFVFYANRELTAKTHLQSSDLYKICTYTRTHYWDLCNLEILLSA